MLVRDENWRPVKNSDDLSSNFSPDSIPHPASDSTAVCDVGSDADSTVMTASKEIATPKGTSRRIRLAVHFAICILVVAGIGRSLQLAWNDLQNTQSKVAKRIAEIDSQIALSTDSQQRQTFEKEKQDLQNTRMDWKSIRIVWIPLSCVFGFFSILMPGILWWIVLRSFHADPPFLPTQAAYAVGSLGKYVPGKAMVPIMRSASMRKWGVPISASILGVIVETLLSLSAAGTLGAITLCASRPPRWLFLVSIAAALCSIIPTIPPIFNWMLKQVAKRKRLPRIEKDGQRNSHEIGWSLVCRCWLLAVIGWILMGTSLFAAVAAVSPQVLRDAFPEFLAGVYSGDIATSLQLWVLCIATASLAFVIGFLSMLPGGAGVRELIVTLLLAPIVGYAPALAAAVLYRITNLVSELAMAGITSFASRSAAKGGPPA